MGVPRRTALGVALGAASTLLLPAAPAEAIPAFSRKYATSCATCHVAFPKLNAFGEAFRRNGYRMPGGDDQYEADKPVKLGAEPWKRLWPEAIWPGTLPYLPPVSLLVDNEYVVEPGAAVNNDFQFPSDVALLTGGTFGDTLSFFGRINLVAPGEGLHVHRLFGQLNQLFGTPLLNVRFGQMEPRAVPFSSNRRLTRYDYLLNTHAFPLRQWMEVLEALDEEHEEGHGGHGEARAAAAITGPNDQHEQDGGAQRHLHGGDFALATTQQGVEIWGAANGIGGRGGFEYAFGVVNGNGAGDFASNGTNDVNSGKDIYWRAAYKFGGLSMLGEVTTAPAQTNNWRDDSLRVGFFGYRGTTPFAAVHGGEELHGEELHGEEVHGQAVAVSTEELFTRLGADVDLWIGNLNLFGAYVWGRTRQSPLLTHGAEAEFNAWFTEADYVIFPWLVGAIRYERVDLPSPMADAERWVPHVTALIRANAKFTFDAALHPNDDRRNRYVLLLTFAF